MKDVYAIAIDAARKRIVRMRGRQLGSDDRMINTLLYWMDAPDDKVIETMDKAYPGGWAAFSEKILNEYPSMQKEQR